MSWAITTTGIPGTIAPNQWGGPADPDGASSSQPAEPISVTSRDASRCTVATGTSPYQLTARDRCALAKSCFSLARNYYDLNRSVYYSLSHRMLSLCPDFDPDESRLYVIAWRLAGFKTADMLASYKRCTIRGAAAKE